MAKKRDGRLSNLQLAMVLGSIALLWALSPFIFFNDALPVGY